MKRLHGTGSVRRICKILRAFREFTREQQCFDADLLSVWCRIYLNTYVRTICGHAHSGEPGNLDIWVFVPIKPVWTEKFMPYFYCRCSDCGWTYFGSRLHAVASCLVFMTLLCPVKASVGCTSSFFYHFIDLRICDSLLLTIYTTRWRYMSHCVCLLASSATMRKKGKPLFSI